MTAQLAGSPSGQPHGGHALRGALDGNAELELQNLVQGCDAEIGLRHLLADTCGQQRALQAHGSSPDQAQALELQHA